MVTAQSSNADTEASEAARREKEAREKEAIRRERRKPLTDMLVRSLWQQRVTLWSGLRRELGLGRFPDVSLKAARIKAMENYLVADRGDDPYELKRRQVRRVPTFAELVEEFIEYRRGRWSTPRAERRWRRSLEIHAYPALRHRLVSEIRARDVADVLNRLQESSPKSVPRVRQQICAVLSCAQALEYLSHAPCGLGLDTLLSAPTPESDYHPALPYAEVPAALARAPPIVGLESASFWSSSF